MLPVAVKVAESLVSIPRALNMTEKKATSEMLKENLFAGELENPVRFCSTVNLSAITWFVGAAKEKHVGEKDGNEK
jgi:hypothetical protein